MPSYATVAEAKAHASFTDVASADERIEEMLDIVEARIEEIDGAWVERSTTETLSGNGSARYWVSNGQCRAITSVKVDGVEEAVGDWTLAPFGRLIAPSAIPKYALIEITYTHGADGPPADIVEAALRATATLLKHEENPRISERTEAIVAEGMTINFANVPDAERGRPFGMPWVDSVIMRYQKGPPVA